MPVSYQDINGNNRGNSGDLKTEDFIDQVKIEVTTMPMDDGGRSQQIASRKMTPERSSDINDPNYESVLHANNIFQRHEIDLYNKTYRFGLLNPYGTVTNAREFLFFTKPDLNIFYRNDVYDPVSTSLNPALASIPFWVDLKENRKSIINALQLSENPKDNFIHLLQNQVTSNLEIPSLSSEPIETPINMYGVGFSYRGTSEASDDRPSFSLEFKDTRWLDVYYFFKAYEEYQTLKHHGVIRPWKKYIEDKVVHDQFSIYKFIVDEDMETILYYGKYYGVMPKSLPRDIFSNSNFENGINFTVEFDAAFYEDMIPNILYDFNAISKEYYNSQPYRIDIHNSTFDRIDNRPAKAAFIEKVESKISPTGYLYKLRWRGSDKV